MLKYLYVSPSDFLVVLVGRGDGPPGGRRRWAPRSRWSSGVIFLGVPFDLAARRLAACCADHCVLGLVADRRPGHPHGRRLPADPPGVVVLSRRPSRAPSSCVVGAVFPLSVLPAAAPGASACCSPLTWWIAGVRQALFPGGAELDRRAPARSGTSVAGRAESERRPRSCSPCWSREPLVTLVSRDPLPVQRTAGQGPRPDRPDDRILTEEPNADLRGQPTPGLRRGPPVDRRVPRPARHARGPASSRLPTASSSRAWSTSRPSGGWSATAGQPGQKETLTFLDDDIAPLHGRGGRAPRDRRAADPTGPRPGRYERALRVLGRYIDEQKPTRRLLLRAGRRVRHPPADVVPDRQRSTSWPSSPTTTSSR